MPFIRCPGDTILIVNPERKVANFYKGFGDFESCSYQTARKLILHEFVELLGEHDMGQEYRLKTDKNIEVTAVDDDDDDDDDVGLDSDDTIEEDDDVVDDDDELGDAEEEEEEDDLYRDDEDE